MTSTTSGSLATSSAACSFRPGGGRIGFLANSGGLTTLFADQLGIQKVRSPLSERTPTSRITASFAMSSPDGRVVADVPGDAGGVVQADVGDDGGSPRSDRSATPTTTRSPSRSSKATRPRETRSGSTSTNCSSTRRSPTSKSGGTREEVDEPLADWLTLR